MRFSLAMLPALVVALATSGCSASGSDQQGATAQDTSFAPDAPADMGMDAGSPNFLVEPGDHRATLTVDGVERSFLIHIPAGYSSETLVPLLFVLHGGNGEGSGMQNVGFDALADRDGGIVVYPDGVQNNWADGRGTTDASKAGIDDVAFFERLIDHLQGVLAVDPERIWVAGVSNGGIMAQTLACDLSDRIGAIGAVVASFPSAYRDVCNPERPVAVIAIHGTEDAFMTFEGGDASHDTLGLGDGGAIESVAGSAAVWAGINGCAPEPARVMLDPVDAADPTRATRWDFEGCDLRVVYYVVEGMGHTWPPNQGLLPRVAGPASPQLDATLLLWEFFQDQDVE